MKSPLLSSSSVFVPATRCIKFNWFKFVRLEARIKCPKFAMSHPMRYRLSNESLAIVYDGGARQQSSVTTTEMLIVFFNGYSAL